ncbi:Branched-chain amino acid ABC transporter, permease protein [Candidatus Defluviicoccus seviourii]|uniref:Branched-chain amino acid ABC transporter, permease protein n=1 Tax=Candidatus Defluviicoccus seviourii TaxID=2565273 RepID=A0A564WD34_9PROT|nr:Branched-chain amino acid ABC transporter, permease protein [Candidatus Defluviicoccus seviourii]
MSAPPRRKQVVNITGLLVLLALPAVALAVGEPFLIGVATRIVIAALAALSLDLILGYGGMVSFGHAAFLGIGAYVVGILAHHDIENTLIPFLPGTWHGTTAALVQWPLAVLASALFALVTGALCLRTSGVYFIMVTLAFAQMLYHFFVSLPAYGGHDGINLWQRSAVPGADLSDDWIFYYVCLFILLAVLAVLSRIVNSRFGMVLQGCKQNEARLAALGIATGRYKLAAYTLAGAIAGLAGALTANQTEFVGPSLMHWSRSGEILVMLILGGIGTLYGAVAGAATFLALEEILTSLTEHWMLFLGPILVFVVLFARRGIYGWLVGPESGDD